MLITPLVFTPFFSVMPVAPLRYFSHVRGISMASVSGRNSRFASLVPSSQNPAYPRPALRM